MTAKAISPGDLGVLRQIAVRGDVPYLDKKAKARLQKAGLLMYRNVDSMTLVLTSAGDVAVRGFDTELLAAGIVAALKRYTLACGVLAKLGGVAPADVRHTEEALAQVNGAAREVADILAAHVERKGVANG